MRDKARNTMLSERRGKRPHSQIGDYHFKASDKVNLYGNTYSYNYTVAYKDTVIGYASGLKDVYTIMRHDATNRIGFDNETGDLKALYTPQGNNTRKANWENNSSYKAFIVTTENYQGDEDINRGTRPERRSLKEIMSNPKARKRKSLYAKNKKRSV